MTLSECRELVLNILQGRLVVGHSSKSDLKALGIAHHHPWWLIRDTTRCSISAGSIWQWGLVPRKLRDLAKEHLQRDIQVPGRAHSPYEDALASLDLCKSVRPQWEAVMTFNMKKARRIRETLITHVDLFYE